MNDLLFTRVHDPDARVRAASAFALAIIDETDNIQAGSDPHITATNRARARAAFEQIALLRLPRDDIDRFRALLDRFNRIID